jgi:acetyl esterase/lipase
VIRRPVALLVATVALALAAAPAAAGARGGADPVPTRVERDVVYRTVNGRDLALDVYRPDDGALHPALLEIHGGGWTGGTKEGDGQLARDLAQQGFVVFVVEYRLAPADPYPAAVEDVQAALAWVRANAREHGADAEAVGAIGGSAGGHLVALLATLDGPQVDAAVSIAGPMDLADPTVSLEAVFFFASFLGCLSGRCEFADAVAASPINHVSEGDAPLFLANSEDDRLVPVTHARRMAAALEAVGVDTELVTPPTGGHEAGPGPAAYSRGVAFLQEHLGGSAPTAPPPAAGGDPGDATPSASDDRGFEVTALLVGIALVVVGVGLVALSRRRRPPRSLRARTSSDEGGESSPGVTARRDPTPVGRGS